MEEIKIGDFVREYDNRGLPMKRIEKVLEIDKKDYIKVTNSQVNYELLKNFKKWKPEEIEWCWFIEDIEMFPVGIILDRFSKYSNKKYMTYYSEKEYQHCFPFIGELPIKLL